MGFFFRKRGQAAVPASPSQPTRGGAGLPRSGDPLPASWKARSQFNKRVSCTRYGAPESLPSTTAYRYPDYCGALIDFDFRIAKADTDAIRLTAST